MHASRYLAPVLLSFLATGCAHPLIAGTQIPDTNDNRAVFDILGAMQEAMQNRSADDLLKLVSSTYFEDMGTPSPADDYGYHELKEKILPQSMSVAQEIYISMEVHDIVVDGDRARADVRYRSRARLELPAGTIWDSHQEFNRVEFSREGGDWRIVRGL